MDCLVYYSIPNIPKEHHFERDIFNAFIVDHSGRCDDKSRRQSAVGSLAHVVLSLVVSWHHFSEARMSTVQLPRPPVQTTGFFSSFGGSVK